MNTSNLSGRRGSALITTIVFCTVLLLLIGSMLRYSASERRLNNRAKLLLEARTAAEAISEYGVAQVKNILESNRTFTNSTWSSDDENLFTTGTYAGTDVTIPPDTFWGGGHVSPHTGPTAIQPLLQVGKIQAKSNESSGLYYIDPTVKDNEGDPLIGKRVFRYDLDILSRAVVLDTFSGGNLPSYMKQTFSVRAVPLFTNAVYYNMDMEVQPGPNMTITGSTFCNSRMFVRSASASPTYITFAGPVTAVKGFWTNFHTSSGDNLMPFFQSINESGSLQTNATTGLVNILPTGDTVAKSMYITTATTGFPTNLPQNTWVESTWDLYPSGETWQQHIGDPSATPTGTHTDTSQTLQNYSNWCVQRFNGSLKTYADGVTPNRIQGIPDYVPDYGSLYPDPIGGATDAAYTYTSSGNDTNNSAHALIETPRLSSAPSYNANTEAIKYAHNVSLYIAANTTGSAATGHKPDGTQINVKAKSYRAFMNDTTTTPATITEVILPGQDNFGDLNATVNPYTTHKNARPIVQLMNIDYDSASGTFNQEKATQRLMTDLRRTNGGASPDTTSSTFIHSTARSATNQYIPKVLKMIDIDMTELKKAVQTIGVATGSTVTSASEYYVTGIPASGVWSHFIYNPAATPTTLTLSDDSRIITTNVTTLTNAFTAAIWNGSVYVESIAADAFDVTPGTTAAAIALRKSITHESRDSGVRLINGRGKIPSIDTNVGFTIATNDAAYILGTFNADGLSTTPSTVAVLVPASPGASTGHNYETGELPASVVADAITLLSQPSCATSGGAFANDQTYGWNDQFSGYTYTSSGYSNSWSTTAPSGSNMHEGVNSPSAYAFKVPYDSASGTWSAAGTNHTTKLTPTFSEYSFAMLCGLVPTGKDGVTQTSGGLHNFPRFLEGWGGAECRIRGSMVALFECRVATEPWNLRVYSPPLRIWGFNLLFDEGHMPPLTPKTIELRRIGANDITKADYNAKLTGWGLTSKLLP